MVLRNARHDRSVHHHSGAVPLDRRTPRTAHGSVHRPRLRTCCPSQPVPLQDQQHASRTTRERSELVHWTNTRIKLTRYRLTATSRIRTRVAESRDRRVDETACNPHLQKAMTCWTGVSAEHASC